MENKLMDSKPEFRRLHGERSCTPGGVCMRGPQPEILFMMGPKDDEELVCAAGSSVKKRD